MDSFLKVTYLIFIVVFYIRVSSKGAYAMANLSPPVRVYFSLTTRGFCISFKSFLTSFFLCVITVDLRSESWNQVLQRLPDKSKEKVAKCLW